VSDLDLLPAIFREMLRDPELGPTEWGAFVAIWLTQPASLCDLARRLRVSRKRAQDISNRLAQRGWLDLCRSGRGRSVMLVALLPTWCQERLAAELLDRYAMAANRGEFLMKSYLALRVACYDYVDNARPDYLTNPLSAESLEYDRLYVATNVAFEFDGPQHQGLTKQYKDERALRQTKARDLIKRGLSQNANVTVVTVTVESLHPDDLEQLIPPHLPRRPVDRNGPYFRTLVSLYVKYQATARAAGQ
jgi:DNA-binding MarR family transcriptional regulator